MPDLLKTETDGKLIKSLQNLRQMILWKVQKHRKTDLAPAAPVPKLDREVAEAAGKSVGLEPIRPADKSEDSHSDRTSQPKPKPRVTDLYRSVPKMNMVTMKMITDYNL